ncbi:MAG: hypothetical protein IT379_22905 [Deltaproteobacteria bacterium]|nr:hypothetical protein [Deltaproteobacteria bacterium]
MRWIESERLPPIELSADELARFAACEEKHFVRASNGALAGHHVDPDGVPPPELAAVLKKVLVTKLLVSAGEGTRAFDLVPKHKLRWIKPSPSGRAFLVYFDTKLERQGVGGGHVVEYPVEGSPRVAVTGCESVRESARLWDADYVGDDDTIVARIGEGARAFLLLLVRSPDSGRFEEVDNLQVDGQTVATCGRVVVVRRVEPALTTYVGVVDRRLVPLEGPPDPAAEGGVAAAFPAGRREVRFATPDAAYVLDVSGAVEGKLPAPRAAGVQLRGIPGEVPRHLSTEERKRCFAPCWSDTRLRDLAGVTFRTREGRVGAGLVGNILGANRQELVLLEPGGEVALHETESKRWWLAGHPTDERALLGDGESLVELDLRTREQVVLGPCPARASYLVGAGRERVITLDRTEPRVVVRAHTPMRPFDDAPLAQLDLGEGGRLGFWLLGAGAFLQARPVGDQRVHDLVRVVETDGVVEFRNEGPLVRPGTRYDGVGWGMVVTEDVSGAGYVRLHDWWFTV